MEFDPRNPIIRLCIEAMDMEAKGKPEEAGRLFLQAWNESTNDFEKFTTAYFVARHQKYVRDRLQWLEKALQLAIQINNESVNGALPSLYRNIAECYKQLDDDASAKKNHELAIS